MDYYRAQDIRKKGLISMMTERLSSGMGTGAAIRSSISDRTKATFTGIKQKFDPLNIARVVTGGSKFAPALLGALTGRSKRDIGFFTGKRKRDFINLKQTSFQNSEEVVQYLGQIYGLLAEIENNKKLDLEERKNKQQEIESEENRRNQAIVKALTARKRPAAPKIPTKKPPAPPKAPPKAPGAPGAPTPPTAPGAPAPTPQAPTPTAPAPKPTAAPAPAPTPPKPTAAPAPTPPTPKPPTTAAPAPKPTEIKPPVTAPAAKPPIIPRIAGKLGAGAGLVISALVAAGLSEKAQANVLAQVKSESNFVPKSENLNYTTAKGIFNTFGPPRIPSEEFAQQFVKNPEALANHVYAKTDGNSEPGDGWKYRGRGFLQITGKNAYKALGDYLKIDLINNPDLLNSPEIAAKSIPWFFLSYKKGLTKGDPKNLENISLVNKAVGFADKTGEKGKKRAELASELESQMVSGTQIDQSSKENKDLKTSSEKNNTTSSVNNVNIVNKISSDNVQEKEDDTNPLIKKAKSS